VERRREASETSPVTAPSTTNKNRLAAARNLGPKSAAVLERVGVLTLDQLRQLGSVRAYSLAKHAEPSVTLNLLWALEGALLDQPWQSVAKDHRTSLLLSLEDHERLGRP
jgi:DNA transformation protein and related proteins